MALKLRQNLLLEAFLESRVELFGAWLILLGEKVHPRLWCISGLVCGIGSDWEAFVFGVFLEVR
ncbi:MAG: hypothetical protein DMG39_28000 [Acidobacteria bacterium]|nr:MAG: hypothetical protein DMG39_28000 [Acidobacteriota bacterium]